ncbi:MAG: hypothetical protein JO110_25075 [Acetobacteraceae bacterium]|nr:hypothetical protein [Acetobacteraceae bacterium]
MRGLWDAHLRVPRAGEAAAANEFARENVVLARPFGTRQFVIDLNAIAVWSRSIDARRDAVIGDVVDWNLLLFDAVIEFLSGWEVSIKLIAMWFMRSIDIR